MSIFLEPEETRDLTGYARQADQRRWLNDRGWVFEQTANGRPIISRSYCESRLSGTTPAAASSAPDFSRFRKSG